MVETTKPEGIKKLPKECLHVNYWLGVNMKPRLHFYDYHGFFFKKRNMVLALQP